MLVVPDVDDVFLPSTSGLFVNPIEFRYERPFRFKSISEVCACRDTIYNLLMALASRHEQTFETESALGSALSASLAALVSFSHDGRVML